MFFCRLSATRLLHSLVGYRLPLKRTLDSDSRYKVTHLKAVDQTNSFGFFLNGKIYWLTFISAMMNCSVCILIENILLIQMLAGEVRLKKVYEPF